MKHVGIEIKFYNLDTFKKQIDVNFIDLDSNSVDLNYKVASLIFCHFWRSIPGGSTPHNGLYGKALPQRGTFFRLQVYKRVGVLENRSFKYLKGPLVKPFRKDVSHGYIILTS